MRKTSAVKIRGEHETKDRVMTQCVGHTWSLARLLPHDRLDGRGLEEMSGTGRPPTGRG